MRSKLLRKVGRRRTRTFEGLVHDHVEQNVSGPPVLHGGGGIPFSDFLLRHLVQKYHDVAPWQLRSSLLRNWRLGPGPGKCSHVLKVSGREAFHIRELRPQVFGDPPDDAASPPLLFLLEENVVADGPVELDQLGVDRSHSFGTGNADLPPEVCQKLAVSGGSRQVAGLVHVFNPRGQTQNRAVMVL